MSDKYLHTKRLHNTVSAEIVIPILFDHYKPKSIVDVGCGTGEWIKVAMDNGVDNILGIDGPHLDKSSFIMSTEYLITKDLENDFDIGKKFDLAISLEVAEHISEDNADRFVESLSKLSDVILFSAAIPLQMGQNHINEQWPDYWRLKFLSKGYLSYDILRPLIWNDKRIHPWYRQNIFLLAKENIKIGDLIPSKTINGYMHPDIFYARYLVINMQDEQRRSELYNPRVTLAFRYFIKSLLLKFKLMNNRSKKL